MLTFEASIAPSADSFPTSSYEVLLNSGIFRRGGTATRWQGPRLDPVNKQEQIPHRLVAEIPNNTFSSSRDDVQLPLTLFDSLGYEWDIRGDGSIGDGTNDAYDGGMRLGNFPEFSTAATEENGREIAIGPWENDSITFVRKLFIPSDAAFTRYLEIVTNTSTQPRTVTIEFYTNLGSDGGELFGMSSSGDSIFTTVDRWLVTDDEPGTGDPSVVHVIAGPGGTVAPSAVDGGVGEGFLSYTYDLQLPPGGQSIIMHFAAQRFNGPEGVAAAEVLGALGGEALTGMNLAERQHVVNFRILQTFDVLPTSGSLTQGQSQELLLWFLADRALEGTYRANLTITSNDTSDQLVNIPLRLEVTGVPEISISTDTLDFGTHFQGFPDTLDLVVQNQGTSALLVSNIAASTGEFSVLNGSTFTLEPFALRKVAVIYRRLSTGNHDDVLTITSDDPDSGQIFVRLLGISNPRPMVAVVPDSLGITISSGDSTTTNLSIQNVGDGILSWSGYVSHNDVAALSAADAAAAMRQRATNPGKLSSPNFAIPTKGVWSAESTVTVRYSDMAIGGLDVAVLCADADEARFDVLNKLIATGRFQSVTAVDLRSTTPTLSEMQAFDAVLVWTNYGILNSFAFGNNLADYIDQGGGVVTAIFAQLFGRFDQQNYWVAKPRFMLWGAAATLGSIYNPLHPLLEGVQSFSSGTDGYRHHAKSLEPTAIRVADWNDGNPVITERNIRGVNRVDLAFYPPSSDVYPGLWDATTDGAAIMANALTYVGRKPFEIIPASGKLSSSGSQDITVNVQTHYLTGGEYQAKFFIQTNDPGRPSVSVPLHLTVLGNPTIAVEKDTLNFGVGYIGFPDTVTLRISNYGSDLLEVSSITAGNSSFEVIQNTSFTIQRNQSHVVRIRNLRTALGVLSSGLTIQSNDTSNPSLSISLQSLTLEPPLADVFPDSVAFSGAIGASIETTLTVYNNGLSDLHWEALTAPGAWSPVAVVERVASEIQQRAQGARQRKSPSTRAAEIIPGDPAVVVERTNLGSASGINIGILAADGTTKIADVSRRLLATGKFGTVTSINLTQVTPTLEELLTYNAILVWTYSSPQNEIELGNLLATYVDLGGGLVTAVFANNWSNYIQGRFAQENYWAIEPANIISGYAILGTVHNPDHPVMRGVSSFNGGGTSYRPSGGVVSGAQRIADWSDGQPFIAERWLNSASRIDLGFYPPSNAVLAEYWDSTTSGATIMANALLRVGRHFVSVEPSSGVVPAGSNQVVTMRAATPELIGGSYRSNVDFASNDPVNRHIVVPTVFDIHGNPTLSVSSDSVRFSDGFLGDPDTLTITVTNNGNDELHVTGFSMQGSGFRLLDSALFNLLVTQSRILRIEQSHTILGSTSAILQIISNDTNNLSKEIYLQASTSLPPTSAGSAVSFDGISQFVEIPYDANSPLFQLSGPFTFEAWINPTSTGPIIARQQCNNAWPSTELYVSGDGPSFDIVFTVSNYNGPYYTPLTAQNVLPAGKWSHVAAVYDRSMGEVKIYVNGLEMASNHFYYDIWLPTTSFWIMGIPAPAQDCWNSGTSGKIDEVRIWNRPRSAAEIRNGMHWSYTASERNLVCNLRFDEGTGLQAFDQTDHHNTAYIRNLATWTPSGAIIGTGESFAPGRLMLAADGAITSDIGFVEAPSGSASQFVRNIAKLFANGGSGNFLVYSNSDIFGNQFRNALQVAGHSVDLSLTPGQLGSYDGIFVGGSLAPNRDSLFEYIRHGGNLYVAVGTSDDSTEESYWDPLTSLYGIHAGSETNTTPEVITSFLGDSLFAGVSGLYLDNPSRISLAPGYLHHTRIVSYRGNKVYFALTDQNPEERVPQEAILVYPYDGSSFTKTTQTFYWGSNDIVDRYRFEIAFDPNFEALFIDTIFSSVYLTISDLVPNTTFWWRVHAFKNSVGMGKSSPVWSLRTIPDHPPGIPSLLSPLDSSLNTAVTPQLVWNRVLDASSYDLQIATDSEFGNIVIEQYDISDSVYLSALLNSGTTYFWRVRGANLTGAGDWSLPWRFTTRVMPDLEVTAVQLPSTAFSGQPFQVSWTIHNRGDGVTATPRWVDQVYLSVDSIYNSQAVTYLGQFENPTYLNPDESYTQTASVTLPRGISGTHFVFVLTDIHDVVPEQNETNNLGRNTALMHVSLSPYTELQVVSVQAPSQAFSDDTVIISWQTKNLGSLTTPSNTWYDAIYLSPDSILNLNTDYNLLNVPHSGVLAPESSYTRSVMVRLPHGAFGTYYSFVVTDRFNTIYEYVLDDNNSKRSDSILIRLTPTPDLVVSNVSSQATGSSGKPIIVQWSVLNEGAGQTFSANWSDRVYLSQTESFIAESSIVLGTVEARLLLPADSSYSRSVWFTLPNGISGDYYAFVKTDWDNREFEYQSDTNNVSRSPQPISIVVSPWANLIPESIQVPESALAGQVVTVGWLVANAGTDTSLTRHDRIYYSQFPTFDSRARVLKELTYLQRIAPGAIDTQSTTVKLPVAWNGSYYLFIETDFSGRVYEYTDEGDNIGSSSLPMTVRSYPPVDIAAISLLSPSQGNSGGIIELDWIVGNIGSSRTVSHQWYDEIYLSADSFLSYGVDKLIGQIYHSGGIDPGDSYRRQVRLRLPNGTSGPHYLILRVDNGSESFELDRVNNLRSSPIMIELTPSADLLMDSLTIPETVTAGQPFTIHWVVRNTGIGTTGDQYWYDGLYISRDEYLDGDDYRLSIRGRIAELFPDSSYAFDLETDMPAYFSGPYFLIAAADIRDDVYEHGSEGNNTRVLPISVELAPLSDLIATDIILPDSAMPGSRILVSYLVTNIGDSPAGGWLRDIVYFSPDSIWSPDDPTLGLNYHYVMLPPGTSRWEKVEVDLRQTLEIDSLGHVVGQLPGLNPGVYRAIVRIDTRNNIRESDDLNNTRVSSDSLKVEIPGLALGVPAHDTLTNERFLYYKIAPPTGSALRISVVSEFNNVSNELYIKYGEVPKLNNFDFADNDPLTANQAVTVPQTQDGFYYVLIRTRSQLVQPVRITADTLAFQLGSVTPPRVGNMGAVTLKIGGARFSPWTYAALRPTGSTDSSSEIRSVWNSRADAGILYATFDLTGKSPGFYDVLVVASQPFFDVDSTTLEWFDVGLRYESILPAALEIVTGMPGKLEAKLHLPTSARRGTDFTATLEVKNTGLSDVPAPLLYISSPNGTPLSLKRPVPANAGSEVQLLVLGAEGRRDVIAPGQQIFIPVYAKATQLPSSRLSLRNYNHLDIPLNWDDIEDYYRDGSPADEWQSTWQAFKTSAGSTWKAFHTAMRQMALRREPSSVVRYYDGSELIADLLAEARFSGLSSFTFLPQTTPSLAPTVEGFRRLQSGIVSIPSSSQDRSFPPSNMPPNVGCDECETGPFLAAEYQAAGMGIAAQFAFYPPLAYVGAALMNFLNGYGLTMHYTHGDGIIYDMVNDNLFRSEWKDGFLQLFESKSRVKGRDLHCGEEYTTTIEDLFSDLPSFWLSPHFNFNNDGSLGLRLVVGAIPGNGVPPPSVTGTVTIKRHCQQDCNGNVTSHYINSVGQIHLHMEDIYDFCPGSEGNVSTGMSNFTIWILQQLETCDYAREYRSTYDIDLFKNYTAQVPLPDDENSTSPPQPPSPSCSSGGASCASNAPPGAPGCNNNPNNPNNPNDPDDPDDDNGDEDNDGDDNDSNDSDDDDGDVPTVASQDPNDITGPRGSGVRRWVTTQGTMPYVIRFENDPAFATAPAQVVNITLPLDSDIDPRSFRLGEFGFGSFIFTEAIGKSSFSRRLDVRDSLGLFVDINAGVDITTGTAFWSFRSVDPVTGEAPGDPLAGFLPVNDSLHRGEGFVHFSVRPRRTASTQDSVIAQADIIFDDNGIIRTPSTFNTLDAVAPASSVQSPIEVIDSTSIRVTWSGADDSTGSGIAAYTVYVSTNGGTFTPWLVDVRDTTALYTAVRDSLYSFFSLARDSAGNIEPMKHSGEASGIITAIALDYNPIPVNYRLQQNYPNPFNPVTTLRYDLPASSQVRFIIYNVLGEEVAVLIDDVQLAGYQSVKWDASNCASGVYFYRLEATGISDPSRRFTEVKKMLLLK